MYIVSTVAQTVTFLTVFRRHPVRISAGFSVPEIDHERFLSNSSFITYPTVELLKASLKSQLITKYVFNSRTEDSLANVAYTVLGPMTCLAVTYYTA
jgi:hypothetical protein